MRIALVLTPMSDHHLRLAAQVGVTDIVTRYPGPEPEALLRVHDRVASFGLKLSIVEGLIPHNHIVHGTAGRDAQIAEFQRLLHDMGKTGVPICCYNWMPDDDWSRTSFTLPDRGGALVSGFDASLLRDAPTPRSGAIEERTLWTNLEYFLKRVAPVAEDAGVKLALHPDDPPMSPLRGQARIMRDIAAFERMLELTPTPANGVCFCQGTFASAGEDIPSGIRRLGPHIHYVHFRDVTGTVPNFRETFHDNGKTDMVQAMRLYREIGFTGPMRPDHVPILDGEPHDDPGYTMLGRLFAVGYMRGLIQAAHQ